jgi:hypothetical protein
MFEFYKDYINNSMETTMIYLYLKEHKQTGMKYLGQTKRDPFKYKGSGKYWRRHIKAHGNDVTTTILGEYSNNEELRKAGEYYSQLWDIVDSDEWANLRPETGDGGGDPRLCEAYQTKWKEGVFGRSGENNPNFGRTMSDENKKAMREGWEKRLREGHAPWNAGMTYDESMLERLRVPHPKAKGSTQTKEHIDARSKALRGRVPGFVGKEHTNETKQAQREAALRRPKKQCTHCNKTVAVNIYSRFHGDKCKHK